MSIARGPFFVAAIGAAAACDPVADARVAAPVASAQPSPAAVVAAAGAREQKPVDVTAGLPKTCGELVIERARLVGRGAGERHPRLVATESAIAAVCTDATRKESLVDACVRLTIEHAEAKTRYGPNHPTMQELESARKVCP